MKNVFVYGTLKSNHQNSRIMKEAGGKLLGVYTIPPKLYALVNLHWYPGVVPFHKYGIATPITGEVWEIPDDGMESLDAYEGYPNLYSREEVDTKFGPAWIYIYNDNRNSINVKDLCKTGIWPEG